MRKGQSTNVSSMNQDKKRLPESKYPANVMQTISPQTLERNSYTGQQKTTNYASSNANIDRNFSGKNSAGKQVSRSTSAFSQYEEEKEKKEEQKRKVPATSNTSNSSQYTQLSKNSQWNNSKKVENINKERNTSNYTKITPRDNRREESKKTEARTINTYMNKERYENPEKQDPKMEFGKMQKINNLTHTVPLKSEDIYENQDKKDELLYLYRAKSPDVQSSQFSYETASWKPQQNINFEAFQNSKQASTDKINSKTSKATTSISSNQRPYNLPSESKDAQEVPYKRLISENQNSEKKFFVTQESFDYNAQLSHFKVQLSNLNIEKQQLDINCQNLQNENEQLKKENYYFQNQIEILQNMQESMLMEKLNSQKSIYECELSELKKQILNLKNINLNLEVIIIKRELFEEKQKNEMHINNLMSQKKSFEENLSKCSMDIWKLNSEKSAIEVIYMQAEKIRLEKQVEDYKATDRILSGTVISSEKYDKPDNVVIELKKEIDDYKFQLINQGSKVKVYYDGIISSLEEQISLLADLNSQLETDLSTANMKLRQYNIC